MNFGIVYCCLNCASSSSDALRPALPDFAFSAWRPTEM